MLSDCLRRLREPVEGALTTDIAWFQGFTFASGLSALLDLTQAHSAVSEGLDRKSTYALASFSLYVVLISFAVSIVLGLLRIKWVGAIPAVDV